MAWILGSIEPLAKCPSAMYCLASATVMRSNQTSSGLRKLSATFSTAVLMMNRSALIMLASKDEPKSLSITASTPTRSPLGSSTTGMPPPPTPTTTNPALMRVAICSASTMRKGMGEATTRRHPRPASSTTTQPSESACSLAVASLMNEPIGLVGFWKPGSLRSTTVRVTTATDCLSIPRSRNSL